MKMARLVALLGLLFVTSNASAADNLSSFVRGQLAAFKKTPPPNVDGWMTLLNQAGVKLKQEGCKPSNRAAEPIAPTIAQLKKGYPHDAQVHNAMEKAVLLLQGADACWRGAEADLSANAMGDLKSYALSELSLEAMELVLSNDPSNEVKYDLVNRIYDALVSVDVKKQYKTKRAYDLAISLFDELAALDEFEYKGETGSFEVDPQTFANESRFLQRRAPKDT